MDVDEQLAAKLPLIKQVARAFIRRTPAIEFDDAVQIVSLAAWRILRDHGSSGVHDVDGAIVGFGYRALIDEVRTGRTGGVSRTMIRNGIQKPRSLQEPHYRGEGGCLTELGDSLSVTEDAYRRIDQDQSQTIEKAIGDLPERDRFIVWLRYWEGLTEREIAEIVGVTESRICQLLARMHNWMRPHLAA